jgi:hypothetical protein
MKTSTIKMLAAFAAVGLLSANVALAKNGGGGGGNGNGNGGNHNSGFKISFGGGGNNGQKFHSNNDNYNKNYHCDSYKQNCGGNYYDNQPYGQVYSNQLGVGRAFEPFHSSYVVLPGDSFYEVSLKEYGTSANAKFIAQFNNMPQSAALVLGQTLMMPAISANGLLTQSRAPAAESLQGTTTNNFSTASNGISNVAPAVEAPRPKVTVGSTLLVDGQSFGDKPGAARLRVGAAALKIEVIEWAGSSVKIRLPQLDLASATNADIEVVRADGSLASKTGIELNAAIEVALTK